jgi:hypothetical protein
VDLNLKGSVENSSSISWFSLLMELVGWMQDWVFQYWHKLHSLYVNTRLFNMIQMDMVVTLKIIIILIFE